MDVNNLQGQEFFLAAFFLSLVVFGVFVSRGSNGRRGNTGQFLHPVCLMLAGGILAIDGLHALTDGHCLSGGISIFMAVVLVLFPIGDLRQASTDYGHYRRQTRRRGNTNPVRAFMKRQWTRYQFWRDEQELKRLTLQEKARMIAAEQFAAEKKTAEAAEKMNDDDTVEEVPAERSTHFQSEESTS